MTSDEHGHEVPQEGPEGREVPEPAPGEPGAAEGRPQARATHLRFGIGLLVLLVLLGWLTLEDGHLDIGLLVYVALLGLVYRVVATHADLSRRAKENLVFGVLSVGLVGLIWLLGDFSNTYLVFVLLTMTIFAIFALGLNLEFGYTGIINFGHVAFMGLGAYTMGILSRPWLDHADLFTRPGVPALAVLAAAGVAAFLVGGILTSVALEKSAKSNRARGPRRRILLGGLAGGLFFAAVVVLLIPYPLTPMWSASAILFGAASIGVILAGAAGVLLGLPTLRLRADYLAIVTIGAAEILRRAFRNEREITGGPTGLTQLSRPFASAPGEWAWLDGARVLFELRSATILLMLLMALAVLLLLVAFLAILLRSPYGRVVRAIREDEEVARALGKNVFLYKLQVLAIGSMFAALAGSFLAWQNLFISPQTFIPLITFYAWIIIVLGGVGNNKGTILGTIILFTFFEATRSLDLDENLGLSGPQGGALRIVVIGLMLVLLMLFKPEGILGRREEMVLGE